MQLNIRFCAQYLPIIASCTLGTEKNNQNCCHQTSYSKAMNNAPIRFRLGLCPDPARAYCPDPLIAGI